MNEPLVIVAAVNGGMQMSRDGARVPVSPEEIAEDARLCRDAGAAIVHVHARDEQGRNTGDTETFRDIIRRIRERTDILIQTTNGIGVRRDPQTGDTIWPTDDERLALVNLDPSPDLYGVAAGSTDFLHPEGGYHQETPYINSPQFLKETIHAVYEKGSTLEYEIVDTHALHRLSQYADDGLLDRHAGYIWLLVRRRSVLHPQRRRIPLIPSSHRGAIVPQLSLGSDRRRAQQLHVHYARYLDGCNHRSPRIRGRSISA